MKRNLILVLCILLVFSLLAACSAPQEASNASESSQESVSASQESSQESASAETSAADNSTTVDNSDITVALVPKVAISYFDDCNTGGSEKAKELGVNYEWVVPENVQGSTQVKVMEELIAKHVDGIAISVNEPQSVQEVIQNAMDAGIKVICFDADAPDSARIMYIGTNNFAVGQTMGEAMAQQIGGKGQVAIITGQLGATNLNERIDGIKKAFESYPDIEIVDIQGTDDDLAKSVTVAETLFRAYPDLSGVLGVSQVGGPACAKVMATKEFESLKGKVAVFAFDDLDDTMTGIGEGFISGTMVQRPITMGSLAVEKLVALIKGEDVDTTTIDTGVTVVTKENMDSYTK